MKIEVRADGLHICGYVNVTGKMSRPVITPRGKCVETIEERAFEKAIAKSGDITVTVDHDKTNVYASTSNGTLELYEDNIGLHASVLITDELLIEAARKGQIRGWSFGMYNVIDEVEQRAENLPLRRVKEFMLDHITLVKNKIPIYAATSVECRADNDVDIETRAIESQIKVIDNSQPPPKDEKPVHDYTNHKRSIEILKLRHS